MTKAEALQAIKTLCSFEAWLLTLKEPIPPYLHEEMCKTMEVLDSIVLKEKND